MDDMLDSKMSFDCASLRKVTRQSVWVGWGRRVIPEDGRGGDGGWLAVIGSQGSRDARSR